MTVNQHVPAGFPGFDWRRKLRNLRNMASIAGQATPDFLTIRPEVRNPEDAMAYSTITSKGQTTIPKSVRDSAGLRPGDRIHFTVLADGTIIVRSKNRSVCDISIAPPKGRRVRVSQMNR